MVTVSRKKTYFCSSQVQRVIGLLSGELVTFIYLTAQM
jgi:hypothetical protein